MASTWVSTLESQPWYSSVASEFAQYAPDVPTQLWQAELYDEDGTLSPTAEDYLSSGHYGLFQENANFPTTVGLAPASTAQLQNPEYNAYVAALAMEQAIKNSGYTTWGGEIEALEAAGWPGTLSQTDYSQRLADLQSIFTQQGQTPPAATDTATTASGSSTATGPFAGIQNAITNATSSLQSSLTGAAQAIFVGGIIVALIAGGFVLLGSSVSGGGGAKPVPVPV